MSIGRTMLVRLWAMNTFAGRNVGKLFAFGDS